MKLVLLVALAFAALGAVFGWFLAWCLVRENRDLRGAIETLRTEALDDLQREA